MQENLVILEVFKAILELFLVNLQISNAKDLICYHQFLLKQRNNFQNFRIGMYLEFVGFLESLLRIIGITRIPEFLEF